MIGIEYVNPSHHGHKSMSLLPLLYEGELEQLNFGGNSRLYVSFIGLFDFLK